MSKAVILAPLPGSSEQAWSTLGLPDYTPPDFIRLPLARQYYPPQPLSLPSTSTGKGKTIVELLSPAISTSVCR